MLQQTSYYQPNEKRKMNLLVGFAQSSYSPAVFSRLGSRGRYDNTRRVCPFIVWRT